ncbi:tetraacyldisaccharide 4'-kinase [Rhizobium halophytocola]|uniref:Tetraacyldisaccharide 4'-kinase n=1 Tax=Rhizobium halophytocola TaxID=735519 RepID=A0ABS4DXM9_9HYPH|nr:tetraacyldisaccharide 4'-kinase [Rhizobium halophytocola]MBP1850442.1 tetraacyldisaccharide 4'-kinase [Rhizobium halophytocola]
MISDAPPFWWKRPDWRARMLWPISFLYGRIAGWRMRAKSPRKVPVPVICVGNFTVGGAGKTPTALTLGRAARARGLTPGFLSRGYGGSLDVTTRVDYDHHKAAATGDEPLLLAREGLTVISRRRLAGARMLIEQGADLIIMDDGFQSNALYADFALVVIDTHRGIGNGHIVPGGPMRAPLKRQMARLSAILKVGSGPAADKIVRSAARAGKPIYVGTITPRETEWLAGTRVLAFAGIADPDKFYRTVEEEGGVIVERRGFADHQPLSDDEIEELLSVASAQDLVLVTTAKDLVRLRHGHGRSADLAALARVVEVDMAFDDHQAPGKIIDLAIDAYRRRRNADGPQQGRVKRG